MATNAGPSVSSPQDGMIQDQHNSNRHGVGTLVPAATGIDDSAARGVPDGEDAENNNLLREWQYPPVAPAVVVGEISSSSGNGNSEGITPSPSVVATFVRDFVRTSIDQMYTATTHDNHDRAVHTEGRQQAASDDDARNVAVLSVRSEADAEAFRQIMRSPNEAHEHPTTVSARNVDDVMNEEAEYILVDGDLIALPRNRSTPRGEDGDGNNDSNFLHQHKPCRPGRMRRGVRKIGKWFGRNRKKHQRGTGSESSSANAEANNVSPNTSIDHSQNQSSSRTCPDPEAASSQSLNPRLLRQSSIEDGSIHSTTGVTGGGAGRRGNHGKKGRQGGGRGRLRKETAQEITEDLHHYEQSQRHPPAAASSSPQRPNWDTVDSGVFFSSLRETEQDHLAVNNPPPPGRSPLGDTRSSGRNTVTATPLGTEDQVLQHQDGHGLPPAAAVVVECDHVYDDGKDGKGDIPASMVPADADFKVDKGEAPDVQAMLVRAEHETTTDLETQESDAPSLRRTGKTEGSSVPLSQAHRTDKEVHNDMVKVVLVGSVGPAKSALARAIRNSTKKPRNRTTLGLDVHTWSASDVNFQIWDVQGSTNAGYNDDVPNFGAHPGTQSLFFSHEALYLLVWDLACHNAHVHPVFDYDSDEEDDNDFIREQIIAEADRALQDDIASRVMSWVDRIARRAPRSAILPVAIIPDGMEEREIQRRCSKMFEMLENYVKWKADGESMPNIILDNSRNVLSVNYSQNYGIKQIQETMIAIATDSSRSVFEHVGTPVPPGAVEILEYTRSVKQHHKLIRLDHILGAVSHSVPVDQAIPALNFLSSVGELLYYGAEQDDILSSFVILSRQWLVSALSCILRNDLKRELADSRKFMNMQCIYSEQKFQENEVIKSLGGGNATCCPLLSNEDAAMLWRSMSFMREAADRYSQMNESSTSAPTMFYFLERLLVHFGIFIPFGDLTDRNSAGLETDSANVYFVPSLLAQAEPEDIWRYRVTENWTTTLCHSWLFRDGTPSALFEFVAVAVLRDLYIFSRKCARAPQLARTRTTPLGRASKHEFVEEHGSQSIGKSRIHQVMCWKSAMLLKIGTLFPDRESEDFRESFVEIFITIVDQNSSYCVASDAMRGNMQRVIVSGKGQSGLAGMKLFKGGYQAVLDSVQTSLEAFNNVNMQIICPECLAVGNPRRASTWGWDEVLAAADERRESSIVCRRGHRVKSSLLVGKGVPDEHPHHLIENREAKPVPEILPSVVLIGLWDPELKLIRSVGSGFVADKRLGLIVTAGHVLFNMEEGSYYGTSYMGIQNARVAIGVIPDKDSKNAVWRYFGEIIADDVRNNVDACVVRINSKLESDVDEEYPDSENPEITLDSSKIKDESLVKLKIESNFDLDDPVRLIGFSQREALSDPEARRQILRSPDVARGYICRVLPPAMSDDSSSSSADSTSKNTFSPREEIVVQCPTIVGHSGGPCVNDEGLVVGILSRADPADPHRCYLVTAGQVKSLLRKARGLCTRPIYTTTAVAVGESERYHSV